MWPWAKSRVSPLDGWIQGAGEDAVGPDADLVDGLAVRPRTGPDRPARVVRADVIGHAPFKVAVVPFTQVVIQLHDGAEARDPSGHCGTTQGARQYEREGMAGEPPAQGRGLVAAGCGQWHVGPPGMPAGQRPLGLAVPCQVDLALGQRVAHDRLVSGRPVSAGAATKKGRARHPKTWANSRVGHVVIFVLYRKTWSL